jgi:hypothetical protein
VEGAGEDEGEGVGGGGGPFDGLEVVDFHARCTH